MIDIDQLLAISGVESWGENPHNGAPEFLGYEIDQKMFAELVAQECIKIAAGQLSSFGEKRIKEHFGIK